MNGSILYLAHQNLNPMGLFICMNNMFTRPRFNKKSFAILMLKPMMKIMTLPFTVVFAMQIPFRITIEVFYHKEFFKYHNGIFNLRNMNTIPFVPYLVGYLMTQLNVHFMTTTHYDFIPMSSILKNNYKSPFAAMNVHLH